MSKKLGTVKQGKQVAVVDYTEKVRVFSRLLNKKEVELFEQTGNLPTGVTVKYEFPVVEHFPTVHEAKQFIANGGRKKPDQQYGVFKSKAQFQLAKKLVK